MFMALEDSFHAGFCPSFYALDRQLRLLVLVVVASVVSYLVVCAVQIHRSKHDVVLRQRGPRLAVFQIACYIMTLVPLMFAELVLRYELFDWRQKPALKYVGGSGDIPLSRIVIKFFVAYGRTGIGLAIPMR